MHMVNLESRQLEPFRAKGLSQRRARIDCRGSCRCHCPRAAVAKLAPDAGQLPNPPPWDRQNMRIDPPRLYDRRNDQAVSDALTGHCFPKCENSVTVFCGRVRLRFELYWVEPPVSFEHEVDFSPASRAKVRHEWSLTKTVSRLPDFVNHERLV